ncbi:HAD family hydrolase [Nocardia aurea]|uniref:HAD family hydrolase n=1 Tax=Nocardia aurea TaxID=2144174 RepID=UPI002FCDD674
MAIVSNSLGDDCYRGFDLHAIADVVVISSEIGVRKPSRRIYEVACEQLDVEPAACLMIDDLDQNLVVQPGWESPDCTTWTPRGRSRP